MLTLALLPAALALAVRVDARVDAELRVVRGTLSVDDPSVALTDPLARLPQPASDRALFRAFPGAPSVGEVTWEPIAAFPGTVRFVARLPRRYGDVGWLSRGLWADGGWYPQPLDAEGRPPVATWDVTVRLPEGPTGVLNGAVGEGTLRWRGEADRAALAVLRDAVVTEVDVGVGRLVVVEHARRERAAHRLYASALDGWPLASPPDVVVVEDVDLDRLARAAPGMVYVSDRAGRLLPGLAPYHRAPLRRAMVAAAVPLADGWAREFVASAKTAAAGDPSVRDLLGWFSWNPVVDALLYDGTLPYFSDVFGEPFGGPPGLWEALGPAIPGRAAAVQLADLRGEGAPSAFAELLLGGATLETAAEATGLPATLVDAWSRPGGGDRDYEVERSGGGARVVRAAGPEAPAEVVVVEVDGERRTWLAGPGADARELGPARRVRVDPDGHTLQDDRADDRWPARWTTVVNAGMYGIAPTQGNVDLEVSLYLRKQGATRGVWVLSADHDAQDLLGVELGYVAWLGPLIDRRRRQHSLMSWAGPAWLDPDFRPTGEGSVALGGGVQYAWDTRTDDHFPLGGHRWVAGVGGGFVPGSDERWASVTGSALQVVSPHPRHAGVARLKAGWASGDVEHRLLPLGGPADMRSIAEDAVVGNETVTLVGQWRAAAIRNASFPVGVGWLAGVHVAPGLEAGMSWRDGRRVAAVGGTLGMLVDVELLGARPSLAGFTAAAPLWTEGFDADAVQVYLDFVQPF